MKKSVAITTIVALHAAVIGMLLVQAGCSSEPEAANTSASPKSATAQTTEIAAPANADISMPTASAETSLPPEGSIARRSDPTRPVVEEKPAPAINDIPADAPLPPAVHENAATDTTVTSVYKVQKGDSISRIAKKHGIATAELMKLNSLSKTSTLKIGQEIKVPAKSEASNIPAPKQEEMKPATISLETEKYVVAKGDSLSRIAHKHGTTVSQIMAANNLKNHNIRVGQKLILPKGGQTVKALAEKSEATIKVSNKPVETSSGEIKYTIKSGDYLGLIAKKHGTTVSAISERNKITDPRKIRVGQVLIIKAGKNVAVTPKVETKSDAKKPSTDVNPPAQVAPAEAPIIVQPTTAPATDVSAPVTTEAPKAEENKVQINSDENMPVVEI